jgi:hypothetical protein
MSGLIFVALALVWAVVLIPKALRHHDEVARTRSLDSFSDEVRVIARRDAVSDREARLVVEERRRTRTSAVDERAAVEHEPAGAARAERASAENGRKPAGPQAHRRAAAAAAKRRRRILAVLLLADVAVGAAAALGYLLPWAPAVPVALTLVFLVVARITVRRERRRWLAARRSTGPLEEQPPVFEQPRAARRDAPAETSAPAPAAAPVARNDQGLAVVSGLDDTSSFPVGLLEVEPTTDAGALWDPLPMTLPTYVTKPRATRSVRTIDLAAAGVSSSGRDAADSALVADAATAADEPGEARRAVGS